MGRRCPMPKQEMSLVGQYVIVVLFIILFGTMAIMFLSLIFR